MDHDVDHSPPAPDTAPVSPDGPLTPDALVRWKSELREFFATVQGKLEHLRQATDAIESSESDPPLLELPAPAHERSSPVRVVDAEDETLDRLQAIKRRLAAQLENSQS